MLRKLLEIVQVAEILSINRARAYELARTGKLPVVRIGRQVRVDPEELDKWIRDGGNPLSDGSMQEDC